MLWSASTPERVEGSAAASTSVLSRSLPPEDRRVNKILIQERDERVKAVEEVHKAIKKEEEDRTRALQGMQRSIDELSKKLEALGHNGQVAPSKPDGREMRELEDKVARQQSQMEGYTKTLQQHASQLQDVFAKIGAADANLRRAAPPPAAAGNMAPSDSFGGNAETRLKEVEDLQGQQVQQLTALRSLVVEVHVNLLLHAVKASRIALRCTDLSKEERRLALQSLDAKERLVREDISKISERFDLTAAGVLKTITGEFIATNKPTSEPHSASGPARGSI
jgi:hypothetical protein